MAFWLVSLNEENWKANLHQGFTVYGMSEPYKRSGATIRKGDVIVMSVMPARIAGILRATADGLSPLGRHKSHYSEPYPYAIAVEPMVILPQATWLRARDLVPELGFAQGYSGLAWRQCFRPSLRSIPDDDGRRLVGRLEEQRARLTEDPYAAATERPRGWAARALVRRHCASRADGDALWQSYAGRTMTSADAWRLLGAAGGSVPFLPPAPTGTVAA